MLANAGEHVSEICEGVDRTRFAGRDERVQTGKVLARLEIANEEKILATEGDAGDARSEALLSSGMRASSRKRPSCPSGQVRTVWRRRSTLGCLTGELLVEPVLETCPHWPRPLLGVIAPHARLRERVIAYGREPSVAEPASDGGDGVPKHKRAVG
jgi:hypothetical protein